MHEYSMFERLPLRSQAEALAKDGTVLAQRNYNNWTVTLYTLYHSFVEVWSGEDMQVISTFKGSANAVSILEPYIEAFEVDDILDPEF